MRKAQKILLAVSAIVALFALWPNEFRTPPRHPSPLWRAHADLRSLSVALESYYSDHHEYPPEQAMSDFAESRALHKNNGTTMSTTATGREGLAGLTTPIGYMTSLFVDHYVGGKAPFAYFRYPATPSNPAGWILFSAGPDRKYQLSREDYSPGEMRPGDSLLNKTYDPTNGTKSGGDMWRRDEQATYPGQDRKPTPTPSEKKDEGETQ